MERDLPTHVPRASDLVLRGSYFQYRRIHSATWVSPSSETQGLLVWTVRYFHPKISHHPDYSSPWVSEDGVSPDLQTEHQIDHMCIGKRFRRTLQEVRVRRGADVASAHHLLVARLKLKLRRNWTGRANQCLGYNTFLLTDTN